MSDPSKRPADGDRHGQRGEQASPARPPQPQAFPATTGASSIQPRGVGRSLRTDRGLIKISDTVVAKIAGMALREIPGLYVESESTDREGARVV